MTTIVHQITHLFDTIFSRLQHADSSDFGMLAVTVIVSVWYVNRYLGD
ncbi:MAG: hypothetical protein ACK5Q5_19635 [Planctomycetaceae bacterium]